MRFSAIHKLSSYLMALCGFGALALSEELRTEVVIAATILIGLSWFFEPPRFRPERWVLFWNGTALAAFGYTVLTAFTRGEWVVAGGHLLTLLLVAKLFTRRSSRDYQWVYVISFLMLVAGTTLNADLSYAICFLGYVVFATWALILFHLRREMEDNFLLKHSDDSSSERVEVDRILNSRRIVGRGFLVATSSVSLIIFALSATMFLLFPRVGFGLFFQKSRHKMTFAGFSDGVTLGGHGLIRTDDTVVMRVKVSDQRWAGADVPELHWRGVAFDHYSGGQWSRSRHGLRTQYRRESPAERTRVVLGEADRWHRVGWKQRALVQEIYLEPIDTSTLFGASTPLAFELDNVPARIAGTGEVAQNDEIRYRHQTGLRYTVYSDARGPGAAVLRSVPDVPEGQLTAYLQLPPELPPRVADLGRKITAGKVGPFAKAEAVRRWLIENFSYTLMMESDPEREPLDYFLFDRKRGHCEYFSSAMAILLRASGVPTRNVNGFLGGEWNEYGGYIAVRGGDAHSWVEVWFEGIGWVTYDPTPPAPASSLGRGGGSALDRMRRLLDNLRLSWFKWVLEYDLGRQLGLMRSIREALDFRGDRSRGPGFLAWVKRERGPIAGGLGGLLLGWIVVMAWRRRGRPVVAPGTGPITDDHPVVALYRKTERWVGKHGHPRPAGTTPREHARRLAEKGAPGAQPFAALTELYYTVRYSAAEETIRGVDPAIASRLAAEVKREMSSAPRA